MFDPEILRKSREYPRTFLPKEARLEIWDDIEPHIQRLHGRNLETREELERWILDLGELEAAIGEEYSLRSIRNSCHTDDEEAESRFLAYVQEVLPRTQPAFFELQRKMLASPAVGELPEKYGVFLRGRRTDVKNFREENVALETQDAVLGQQYDKLCGEQMVDFDGQVQTLPQVGKLLEETDRPLRERAWCAMVNRRVQDAGAMEDIFDQMISFRHQMARNAGFESFVDLQFERYHRFDYTPDDCLRFHDAVEKVIVPLSRRIQETRRRHLGVEKLRPWDLAVDPLGRAPIRPFVTAEELVEGTNRVFRAVDPFFEGEFSILRRHGLLDLESRKGKAPGGYQCTLDEVRLPFIFMNAAGTNGDVFTLIHEGGHAFHALATRSEALLAYRSAPIEFCEVASMGMEMMAAEHLETFYSPEDAQRARRSHLEQVISLMPWIARVDAFQHWIYRHPGHSREERRAQWMALDLRFGEMLDWPGEFADWRAVNWVAKLHFFRVPLYYIEYGIAQLGALQLWRNYRRDPAEAVRGYRRGLTLGGGKPLPELFRAAGLSLTLDSKGIEPLVADVESVLTA